MSRVWIIMGPAGSGKSTTAEKVSFELKRIYKNRPAPVVIEVGVLVPRATLAGVGLRCAVHGGLRASVRGRGRRFTGTVGSMASGYTRGVGVVRAGAFAERSDTPHFAIIAS